MTRPSLRTSTSSSPTRGRHDAARPGTPGTLAPRTAARSRRTPRASFFTVVFPLILLALLNSTAAAIRSASPAARSTSRSTTRPRSGSTRSPSRYVAPIFGLASARELGILKRVRGTPLSPWIYVAAWLAATIIVGLAAMTLMIIVSVLIARVPHLPRACCRRPSSPPSWRHGAVRDRVRRRNLRAPRGHGARDREPDPLPDPLLSGCFARRRTGWVRTVANVFPLYHIVRAFTACFSPFTQGSGFRTSRPRRDRGVGRGRPGRRRAPVPLGVRAGRAPGRPARALATRT